eukprot:CAMPEP_0206515688 /NCGR_PEP_ID=MMETSP0324_2-20121206/62944_1 /ASSEMBLY_ACC=CAM_ASM_000836 /TAXON_ID=2866 /ORGANISM="Crypthecodinium cohnii, Strain Seligo" /LENGTH=44 /DNA_ID= /DNA_START= /DNA_END= /DNA_ORIENTATION=
MKPAASRIQQHTKEEYPNGLGKNAESDKTKVKTERIAAAAAAAA